MTNNDFHLLGETGLRVAPLALGAMTFGWGANKDQARALFRRYFDWGGNFVDTADAYGNGASETPRFQETCRVA